MAQKSAYDFNTIDLVTVKRSADKHDWPGLFTSNHPDWHRQVYPAGKLPDRQVNPFTLAATNRYTADFKTLAVTHADSPLILPS
jgi:hypothetical protein